MKKNFLFLMFLLILSNINLHLFSQPNPCLNPPICIQNGALVAVPALGDMNNPAMVNNWFPSHGTPSCGGGTVWMWSYGGNGEGAFTCYNFVANRTYQICFTARYAGTNPNGVFQISAHSNLLDNAPFWGTTIPTTPGEFLISSIPITNTIMAPFSLTFTPTTNFSQLWLKPFLLQDDGKTQYAVEIDNIHIEDMSIPNFTPTITASGPFLDGVPVTLTASGGPAGTQYVWSTSAVGPSISVIPDCNKEQIITVTANYNNCPPPAPNTCTRRSEVASIKIIAINCCSDTCYWKVTGNNIIANNNIFGTLTPPFTPAADVRMFTSGIYRGIMDRNGHWGKGTSPGFLPDGILQVHRNTEDKHLDITGKAPSIKFYGTEALPGTWPNTGPKIGLVTSPNNFTNLSSINDFVIENTSNADIIFGTNWNGTNCLERMKVDNKGEVGINTVINVGQDPTAFLHVNCTGNNTTAGLSDVRFENLEPGNGKIMVINNTSGYVYNSGVDLPSTIGNVSSTCVTANFIPKVQTTGSPNLICSQVFDNGTNVGVGNTTPGAKLDVLANGTGFLNVGVRANASSSTVGINLASWNTSNSTSAVIGLGSHNTSNNNSISIGGTGMAIGSNATTSKIGLWGVANANSCSGNNVGIYGQVNSSVGFCSTHFAGYFAGQTLNGGPALVISDSSLKTNIEDLQNGMEIINALRPRTYDFDSRVNSGFALTDKHQYGFISQEVEQVLPDVVTEFQGPASIDINGNVIENRTKYKALNYDALIAVLVKGLQEQNERINALEEIVNNCCGTNNLKSNPMESATGLINVKLSENSVVLNQNVPNPFAESTYIAYQLPEAFKNAQIVFSNSTGQIIKVVEITEPGKGGLNVFADDLSKGHYSYSLIIDGKTIESKKMIKQ